MHQRPLRAATELLQKNFSLGAGSDPLAQGIVAAYEAMIPEVKASSPGMGAGLAVSVDQVRKVVLPRVLGTVQLEPWRSLGFASQAEWWQWCRENRDIAAETCFSVADLFDFRYGARDLPERKPKALELWRMATSNLGQVANELPTGSSVDAVLQPICLVVELSLKAALVFRGADPKDFKGPKGHDLKTLAALMHQEAPHRDDQLVKVVVDELPSYVASRYEPAGLTRLHVVRLALAAQFVAASTLRRLSTRDTAAQFEAAEWPGPRRPFFS
jgi:HEPN domain-containing protein